MSPRIRFHDGATRDIADAIAWYEEQRRGLGLRFVRAVRARVADVLRVPGITRRVTVDGEEALRVFVPRFPYIVFMVDVGGRSVRRRRGARASGAWLLGGSDQAMIGARRGSA